MRLLFTCLCLLSMGLLMGQNSEYYEGMVRELNSGKTPVSGVLIQFSNGQTTTSRKDGTFRLQLSQTIPAPYISEVQKKGYLWIQVHPFAERSALKKNISFEPIILARGEELEKQKSKYAIGLERILGQEMQKVRKDLQKSYENGDLKNSDYLSQLSSLYERYNHQKEQVDTFAASFARINYDDEPLFVRFSFEQLQAGNWTESIRVLEQAQIDPKIRLHRLLDVYRISLQHRPMEKVLNELLFIDSTNLMVLNDAGCFFREHQQFDRASDCFKAIIHHPMARNRMKGLAHQNLGMIHLSRGKPSEALFAFGTALAIWSGEVEVLFQHPDLLTNRALAHIGMADTQWQLGNEQEARNHLKETIEVLQPPSSLQNKRLLMLAYQRLGDWGLEKGLFEQAKNHFQKSILQVAALIHADQYQRNTRRKLASVYGAMGFMYSEEQKLDSARLYFARQMKMLQALQQANPYSAGVVEQLAIAHHAMGNIWYRQQEFAPAIDHYLQVYERYEELTTDYPENVSYQDGFSHSLLKLGKAYFDKGDNQKAIAFLEAHLEMVQELTKSTTEISVRTQSVATAHEIIAEVYAQQGLLDQAEIHYNVAARWYDQLRDQVGRKKYVLKLIDIHCRLGDHHMQQNRLAAAVKHYEKVIDYYNEIKDDIPAPAKQMEVGKAFVRQGVWFLQKEQFAQAYTQLFEGLTNLHPLLEQQPDDLELQLVLAEANGAMGDLYLFGRQAKKAIPYLNRCVERREHLLKSFPIHPDQGQQLLRAYQQLARALLEAEEYASALQILKKQWILHQDQFDTTPFQERDLQQTAEVFYRFGVTYTALDKLDEAFNTFKKCLEFYRIGMDRFPKNQAFPLGLARAHEGMATSYVHLSDSLQALHHLQKALQYLKPLYQRSPVEIQKDYLRVKRQWTHLTKVIEPEKVNIVIENSQTRRTNHVDSSPSTDSLAVLVKSAPQYYLAKATSLRKAATHKSDVIRRLSEDTSVVLLEKTSKYWWLVALGEQIGYVKARLLVAE